MKFSYSQKLYYKAIAKLLIGPAVLVFPSVWMVWHFGSIILASATLLYTSVLILMGFFSYPLYKKIESLIDSKVDPIYNKYVEAPLMKERDSAKRGMDGEATVHAWLREICSGDEWFIVPNCVLPDIEADIDFVLIGKKGIFVFEVKNYTDQLYFTPKEFGVIHKDGTKVMYPVLDDPRKQVLWNAHRLENFLSEKGMGGVRTKLALVFPEPESMKYEGSPIVFLIDNKETLKIFIETNPDDPEYTKEFCAKIAEILKG